MKKIVIFVLVILFILNISGCGARPAEVKSMQKVENQVVVFDFPEKDPIDGELIDFDIFNFSKEIVKFSRYHEFKRDYSRTDMNEHYYNGLKVLKMKNSYLLKYLRGYYRWDVKEWYLTEVVFKISFVTKGKKVIFTLEPSYNYNPASSPIGMPIKKLTSFEKLEKDAKLILSKLGYMTNKSTVKSMPFTYTIYTNLSPRKVRYKIAQYKDNGYNFCAWNHSKATTLIKLSKIGKYDFLVDCSIVKTKITNTSNGGSKINFSSTLQYVVSTDGKVETIDGFSVSPRNITKIVDKSNKIINK